MPISPFIVSQQLANTEETLAGTADNKAVTPRGLMAALKYQGLLPLVKASWDSIYIRIDATNMPFRGNVRLGANLEIRFDAFTPADMLGYIKGPSGGANSPGLYLYGDPEIHLVSDEGVQIGDNAVGTGGGLYVGNGNATPPNKEIWASGSIWTMGGLAVTPSTSSVPNGGVWASGNYRGAGLIIDATLTTGADTDQLWILGNQTFDRGFAFGNNAGIRMAPKYTGTGGVQVVTRHNYIVYQNIEAVSATATDAVAMYFDKPAGFHRVIDTGIVRPTAQKVKASMNTVDCWLKVQIGSSLGYIPIYMSKFS